MHLVHRTREPRRPFPSESAMTTHRYAQVDVFTARPLRGNPLAVVFDAEGLDPAQMQALARWTNLSDTSFVLPPADPAADYRLRIFTPHGELPFAGHPTLGSCHAWLQAGGRPRGAEVVQECGVGLVRIRRGAGVGGDAGAGGGTAVRKDGERRGAVGTAPTGSAGTPSPRAGGGSLPGAGASVGRLAFAAPPLRRSGPADDLRDHVARALRVAPASLQAVEWIDNGPGWIAALLPSAAAVLALEPDFAAMQPLRLGVVGPYPAGSECAVEVRAFVPTLGVPEDPVTGSLHAGLAQWLIASGRAPARYVASQGTWLGRAGRVHVERLGDDCWIGGDSVTCIEGTLTL